MSETPDPRYRKFVELFNREQFFEAHEVLESLWRETSGPARNFYQGLIQVAAAFVHVQRKNPEGAEDLYAKALKHLAAYAARYQGMDADRLIKAARKTLDLQKNFPKIDLGLPSQQAKG